jgi:hypothetical protein
MSEIGAVFGLAMHRQAVDGLNLLGGDGQGGDEQGGEEDSGARHP